METKQPSGTDRDARVQAFRQSKIFGELPEAAIEELLASAVLVRFAKGDTIFCEGDPAEFFYIVQSGIVKLYKGTASGKNLTVSISSSGETLNGLALSLDDYFMTSQAMSDLTVLRVPRKDFGAFVQKYPDVAIRMVAVLARRMSREYDRLVDTIGERIETRLAHSLLVLARKFGPRLTLTREELADYAGTTTETTIRVLSKLKRDGIISSSASRGEIMIADMEGLEDYEGL